MAGLATVGRASTAIWQNYRLWFRLSSHPTRPKKEFCILVSSRFGGGFFMRRKSQRRKNTRPKLRLGLPDLDQSKSAVLGSLRSPESQRGYRHAIEEFVE
jgi:hypothetical protein